MESAIDVVYCWKCKEFSFVRRKVLRNKIAMCQHEGCMSSKLGDVGDVQRELIHLSEHSKLDKLIELAPKAQIMFNLNDTPMEEREIGRA